MRRPLAAPCWRIGDEAPAVFMAFAVGATAPDGEVADHLDFARNVP